MEKTTMLHEKVTITNKLGLHARASAKLVAHASRFASNIEIEKEGQRVNGKSIMGVMMLGATKGTELDLYVEGEDQNIAMQDMLDLINSYFGESE